MEGREVGNGSKEEVVYIKRADKESGLLQVGLITIMDPTQSLFSRRFAATFGRVEVACG
jgi:hypothetical protein